MIKLSRRVPFVSVVALACGLLVAAPSADAAPAGPSARPVAAPRTAPMCVAGTCTATYATPGTGFSFAVPAGVAWLSVTVDGGAGGTNANGDVLGGPGARITAVLAVSPGSTLTLNVGGAGIGGPGYNDGGVGGGGDTINGGSGGGASDVLLGSTVVLVAGGGGGAGADQPGCYGSRARGGAGGNADASGGSGDQNAWLGGGGGGQPGTTSGPGAGGVYGVPLEDTNCNLARTALGYPGTAGSGTSGGAGYYHNYGGGGGGGYYGGGSGGGGAVDDQGHAAGSGGGGGGASFIGAQVSTATINHSGSASDGDVVIAYIPVVCANGFCSSTYSQPGLGLPYTVPSGITTVAVLLDGGVGGTNSNTDVPGGAGAQVTALLDVTPGEQLRLDVGGAGGGGNAGNAGGVNGGGAGVAGGGGGGASDIIANGTTLLAAGGGGGAGADQVDCNNDPRVPGGAGGNADTAGRTGASAPSLNTTLFGGGGGQPGTTSGPGAGGIGGGFSGSNPCGGSALHGPNGSAGSGEVGGTGSAATGGGGGGGGYDGGGSGAGGASDTGGEVSENNGQAGSGGGGGGASYVGGTGVSNPSVDDTANRGNGQVIVEYLDPVAVGSPSYSPLEGRTLTVPASSGLLSARAGTTGPSGDTLHASGPDTGTTAHGGQVSVNSDGSFTYTPPSPGFHGTDSFPFTVTDPASGYATGTVTIHVQRAWPSVVSGQPNPPAGAARGYYLGVARGDNWFMRVTHPGTAKTTFTGTITINAGRFTGVGVLNPENGNTASAQGKTITFSLTNYGDVDGIVFTTPASATSITFTLTVNQQPATAGQIHLGNGRGSTSSGSPLTFTR